MGPRSLVKLRVWHHRTNRRSRYLSVCHTSDPREVAVLTVWDNDTQCWLNTTKPASDYIRKQVPLHKKKKNTYTKGIARTLKSKILLGKEAHKVMKVLCAEKNINFLVLFTHFPMVVEPAKPTLSIPTLLKGTLRTITTYAIKQRFFLLLICCPLKYLYYKQCNKAPSLRKNQTTRVSQ